MSTVDRYAVKLRAFVEAWDGRSLADICYMTGRKMRRSGQHWSTARRLTYAGQRLARLGYWDEAHGLPDRLEQEQWHLWNNHTLHKKVEFLYVVDGYEATVTWGDEPMSPTYKGSTLREALAEMMQVGDILTREGR